MNNSNTLIFYADTAVFDNHSLFEAAYRRVSGERQKKTDRLHFQKDKNLSLGAELLLMKALSEFNLGITDFSVGYSDFGKPFVKNNNGVYFNISHSEKYALCTVSDSEVGCDIERIKEVDLKIAERFFCRGEFNKISKEESTISQNDMFFRLWTLKESFIKATGLGMKLPLDKFEIVFDENGIDVIQNELDTKYFFKEYECVKGYKIAVCKADRNIDGEIMKIRLEDCV